MVVLNGLRRTRADARPPAIALIVRVQGETLTVRLRQAHRKWCSYTRECHISSVVRSATEREVAVGVPLSEGPKVRQLSREEITRLYPGVEVSG